MNGQTQQTQQQLEQKNITIAGVEDVGWGLKLKDDQGMVFNVPKLKKDTQIETAAFQSIKNLQGYGMNTEKCLKFVTVLNQQGGQSRYVRIISEPQAGPVSVGTVSQTAPIVNQPNVSRQKPVDWEKKSFGMCKHGFLIEKYKAMLQGKGVFGDNYLSEVELEAEEWATMSMRKLDNPLNIQEQPKGEQDQSQVGDTNEIQVDNPF